MDCGRSGGWLIIGKVAAFSMLPQVSQDLGLAPGLLLVIGGFLL